MCRFTSTALQFLTQKPYVHRRNWTLSISGKDMHGLNSCLTQLNKRKKKGRQGSVAVEVE